MSNHTVLEKPLAYGQISLAEYNTALHKLDLDEIALLRAQLAERDEIVARMRKALGELANACAVEFNEKGAGGYALARLTDARLALSTHAPDAAVTPFIGYPLMSYADAKARGILVDASNAAP